MITDGQASQAITEILGHYKKEQQNLVPLLQEVQTRLGYLPRGSLCGLGQTAPNPILTTLRYFRDEYEAHILEKRCPARVCPELTVYYILPDRCDKACEHCILTCPTEAIKGEKGEVKIIDQEKCSKCGTCLEGCPREYNAVVKLSPVTLLPSPNLSGKKGEK